MKNIPLHIARVTTIPQAFVHINPLINELSDNGTKLTLISSEDSDYWKNYSSLKNVSIEVINISREIDLINDIKSLLKLIIFFRKQKFDIIHSSTPKAGLLCSLAGLFCSSKVVHTFTGQKWATLSGFKRYLLKQLDKLVIYLNDRVYADSPSQIQYLENEGVSPKGKIFCLNKGSYGGIDLKQIDPDLENKSLIIRNEYSIESDEFTFLFLGRINPDKGILDLLEAFKNVQNEKCKLLIVGPLEDNPDFNSTFNSYVENDKRIHYVGFVNNPWPYYKASDVLCLPSYREGFGTVVLEAAACGIPTIGTRIPGLVDAIDENNTGLLFNKKDIKGLENLLRYSLENKSRIQKLGEHAQLRCKSEFSSEIINRLQIKDYQNMI